jgi:hypothetical protein
MQGTPGAPEAAPLSEDLRLPKRPLWPFLILAILLLGGLAFLWRTLRRPDPMTVLVAVQLDGGWWEGSKPSATLADGLAEHLEKIGFVPLKSGDPKVTEALERAASPLDAAKKLDAAFVIYGKLEPKIIEHPIEGGYFETRLEAKIQVAHVGEQPVDTQQISSWSGAKNKEQALDLLGDSLSAMVFDAALPVLLQHPDVKALSEGGVGDKTRVMQSKAYVELRAKKLTEAKTNYDKLPDEKKNEERGRREVKYLGPFDRAAALCGVTKKGVVAHIQSVKPFFSPMENELGYLTELERIVFISPNGEEQEMYRGYNVYGYPGVDRDGKHIVLIEDIFGWARAVTLVDAPGQSKRLLVDPRRYPVEPALSTDGSAVALWDRACKTCAARLLVIALPSGNKLYAGGDGETSLAGLTWVGPKTLVFLERPPPEQKKQKKTDGVDPDDLPDEEELGDQHLMELDLGVESPKPVEIHKAVAGESYGPPAASGDGRYIAMSRWGPLRTDLAVFDRQEKKLTVYDVPYRVERPAVSPDGRRVAFEQRGDIMSFGFDEQKVTRLTQNPSSERYPLFSLDGKSVVFESRTRDPNFERRLISSIGSVGL